MKKLLSLLGAIGLTAAATSPVVACGSKNSGQEKDEIKVSLQKANIEVGQTLEVRINNYAFLNNVAWKVTSGQDCITVTDALKEESGLFRITGVSKGKATLAITADGVAEKTVEITVVESGSSAEYKYSIRVDELLKEWGEWSYRQPQGAESSWNLCSKKIYLFGKEAQERMSTNKKLAQVATENMINVGTREEVMTYSESLASLAGVYDILKLGLFPTRDGIIFKKAVEITNGHLFDDRTNVDQEFWIYKKDQKVTEVDGYYDFEILPEGMEYLRQKNQEALLEYFGIDKGDEVAVADFNANFGIVGKMRMYFLLIRDENEFAKE